MIGHDVLRLSRRTGEKADYYILNTGLSSFSLSLISCGNGNIGLGLEGSLPD